MHIGSGEADVNEKDDMVGGHRKNCGARGGALTQLGGVGQARRRCHLLESLNGSEAAEASASSE